MAEKDDEKGFDLFEVLAASLLGLGAVGAALAGYQNGLWGGTMTDNYSLSAASNTKGSALYSEELSEEISDAQANLRAKELTWAAIESDNEELRTRNFEMASWIYVSQMSNQGYASLKLPAPARQAYEEKGEDQVFSVEQLEAALERDLDEDDSYENALYAGSKAEFAKAEGLLEEARKANTTGDQFALAGVIQTIGLFFAGLALVFRTRIRWGFLGAGAVVFTSGLVYMLRLPWL